MPDSNAVLVSRSAADGYAADLLTELEDNAAEADEHIAFEEWTDQITITYPDGGKCDLGRVIDRSECDDPDCEACE